MAPADDLPVSSPEAHTAPAGIRLQLIGTACLLRGSGGEPAAPDVAPASHVLERRDAALMALLAIDGSVSRARVVSLLWPDSDARRGGNSLRQRLFRLKRWAGCDVVVGDRSIALSGNVRLLHGGESGDGPAGDIDFPNNADLLGTLYYGDCGELAEWIDGAREQHRATRRRALEDAVSRLEDQGRLEQALELAERLLREEPAAEHAHRRVMQLHYLRGDRAAALGAFERCARQLKREFKAPPGRETLLLASTIERGDPLLAESPPGTQAAATARGSLSKAPSRAAPGQRPATPGLPLALRRPPRLVGRATEWQRLESAVSQCRTVWLTGAAGIGKSRLLADFARARRWPAPTLARPGDEQVPYALLARWLDLMRGQFGELHDPAAAQALAGLLPRSARPRAGAGGASPAGQSAGTEPVAIEPARLLLALEAALAAWHDVAARLLGAGAMPGIVLDDLQFADAASLALIGALAASGHGAPALPREGLRAPPAHASGWVWLLGRRDTADTAEAGNAPALVDAHATPSIEVLRLPPLAANDLSLLLDSLQLPGLDAAAWTAPLLGQCGGNPGFVIDALAAQHANGRQEFSAGPQAVPIHSPRRQAVLESCLARLPAAASQLALTAAVAGPDFSVELAAATAGCAPVALSAAWRVLEDAGLFDAAGFIDEPVRRTALAGAPTAIRVALHRQIARWLAGADGMASAATVALTSALPSVGPSSAAPAARVAAHCEAAQDWALAASAYRTAAAQARAGSARRDELEALVAAARCHRAAARPSMCDVATLRGEGDPADHSQAAFDCDWRAVHLLISLESADVALAHADALLQCATGAHQRAAALEARARVLGERFEPEAALADARAAMELAREAGAPRLQLLATQRAAAALMRLARPDEAVAAQQAWRDTLDPFEDEERLFWLSDHATALDYADRRTEAVAMFDRAIAQAERLAHWTAASEAWGNKAIALMYLNRMHESMQASRRAIECGQRAGSERGNLLIDEMTLAGSLRDLGQFDAYLARADGLPRALREVGYPVWAFNAENDLAVCFLWLGRPELARQALSAMPDDLPPMMRASRLFTQARLARGRPVVAGEPDSAALVRRAHQLLASAGGTGRSYVRLKVALELARDADPAEALERVQAIEAEALQREQFMLAMQALVVRTEMLTRLGDARAAVAGGHLMDCCLRDGPPPGAYAPEVWWVAHAALVAADPARARGALARALAWIEETAASHLPAVFRASFLERNPVNVAVRAAALALQLERPARLVA